MIFSFWYHFHCWTSGQFSLNYYPPFMNGPALIPLDSTRGYSFDIVSLISNQKKLFQPRAEFHPASISEDCQLFRPFRVCSRFACPRLYHVVPLVRCSLQQLTSAFGLKCTYSVWGTLSPHLCRDRLLCFAAFDSIYSVFPLRISTHWQCDLFPSKCSSRWTNICSDQLNHRARLQAVFLDISWTLNTYAWISFQWFTWTRCPINTSILKSYVILQLLFLVYQ